MEVGGEDGVLEEDEKNMITSIFEFASTTAKEIMVPRVDIIALEDDIDFDELLKNVKENSFSRMPIYHETIDNIIGVLYVKDLLEFVNKSTKNIVISELVREVTFIPESKDIGDLLKQFQKEKTHISIFMYFINAITSGDVFAVIPENIARHIAMAHTMFNVVNVIVFLPFIAVIAKICNFFIKVKDEESVKIQYLEPHLLETPSIALKQVVLSLQHMLNEAWSMVNKVGEHAIISGKTDEKFYNKLMKQESGVDEMQTDITDYLVTLTQKELTSLQAEAVPLLMHCTNDAERIGDHAEIIFNLIKRLKLSAKKFSEEANLDLNQVWELLCDQAQNIILYLENAEIEKAEDALKKGKKLEVYMVKSEKNHIKRLKKGKCKVVAGIVYIELLTEFNSISNRLTNIAERMPKIQNHYLKLAATTLNKCGK